ncbi:hypothetical protein AVEN_41688-1 [Araneus ventricosus]|uniref:RNase H type-1 domain-containing protein n=1 Tax=Araneus ventricosus TaxID=182803 RepID=A0A4Y2UA13_ARAVE|nr:hypothetical protein AVEN_192904-1 [Araneus ventricosus]GBO08936.1 hypothetical protein AVEN_41688-1 [Araneus ventricosus]
MKSILKDSTNIRLCWIKAHVGISGNEATKKEADDINVKFSKKWLKNYLQRLTLERWQARWELSQKARYTYGLLPRVSFDRCFGDFFLNQFMTGHGVFPVHQMKFYGKSDLCHCERDQGTITHYLYGCTSFLHMRQAYFPADIFRLGLLDLIALARARSGLRLMIQFLLQKCLA